MPVVKKKATGAAAGAAPAKKGASAVPLAQPVKVSLPDKLSVPAKDLTAYTLLIYGEKKIGKTSLAAHFPGALFLMFEPGGKALEIYQRPVNSWLEFVAYVDLLEKDTRFQTIVIDTVDIAYRQCFEAMCRKMAIQHPSDENDFGKSWGVIEVEFGKQMARLAHSKGVLLLSHASVSEIKSRTGESFQYLEPSMPKQAMRYVTGVVDVWAYYGYLGKERRLLIQGDEFLGAGNRLQETGKFCTPDGKAIVSIPMGTSSTQAYRNLIAAFDGKQKTVGEDMLSPSIIPQKRRPA